MTDVSRCPPLAFSEPRLLCALRAARRPGGMVVVARVGRHCASCCDIVTTPRHFLVSGKHHSVAGRLQVLCDRLCDCLTGLCVRVGHGRSQELIVSPPPLADGKTSLDSLRSVQFSDDYYPTRVKSSVCVCVRGARLLRNIFPSITGHGRKEEMW